eukprot:1196017-Prorocentrum_minimum.AAC.2
MFTLPARRAHAQNHRAVYISDCKETKQNKSTNYNILAHRKRDPKWIASSRRQLRDVGSVLWLNGVQHPHY